MTFGPGVAGGQAFQFSRANPGFVSSSFVNNDVIGSSATVEGWINPATLPAPGQEYVVLSEGNPAGPNAAVLLTNVGGSTRLAYRYLSTSGEQTVISAPISLTPGAFRYIAVAGDASRRPLLPRRARVRLAALSRR